MTQIALPKPKVINRPFEADQNLAAEALSAAEEVSFRGKVVDTVTIYKLVASMSMDLSGDQLKKCHTVGTELEESLKTFLSRRTLPERKLSVRSIFA